MCRHERGSLFFGSLRQGLPVLALFLAVLTPAQGGEREKLCDPGAFPGKRERMVSEQIRARGVKDERVLDAMRRVSRHCFVPAPLLQEAYEDHPLPIGLGQTISQPYIVAFMTEVLDLKPSHRVLEIGTGSGYQTAVLAALVREVYSIEIHESLAQKARSRLSFLGTKNVEIKHGDGYYGWKNHAPFDAVMVTAAAHEIPPPLLRQLKSGGRMCIPVGGIYQVQQLTLVNKDPKGVMTTKGLLPVRFVPLLGRHP